MRKVYVDEVVDDMYYVINDVSFNVYENSGEKSPFLISNAKIDV